MIVAVVEVAGTILLLLSIILRICACDCASFCVNGMDKFPILVRLNGELF